MTELAHAGRTVGIEVSGPQAGRTVAEYELFFARRALAKLKSRLGRERLIELLKPDTDEAGEKFSRWLEQSDGEFRPAVTEMRVTGLTAEEFFAYFDSIRRDEPKMLAAQPEHFVIAHTEEGFDVIENTGPYISHFNVHFTGEEQAVDELLPDYPVRMVGHSTMLDGKVKGHVLHQLRDTSEGFDARLAIYFPAAVPEEVIEGHRQHLAVEFSNWIAGAAEALGRTIE